jgi:hypothetical protein
VAVYTVHEPPDPPADRFDRAEALVFVRDGFSWGVALIAPFWLAIRGEWLVLAIYIAAALALAGLLTLAGAQPEWVSLASVALNIFFGFEAGEIRRWLLTRRGWHEIATVGGRNRDECERRFFEAWLKGEQPAPPRPYGHPEVRALTGGWVETQARSLMNRLRSQFGTNA